MVTRRRRLEWSEHMKERDEAKHIWTDVEMKMERKKTQVEMEAHCQKGHEIMQDHRGIGSATGRRIHRSTTEKYSARFSIYLIWWVRLRVRVLVVVWVMVTVGARVMVGVGLVRG